MLGNHETAGERLAAGHEGALERPGAVQENGVRRCAASRHGLVTLRAGSGPGRSMRIRAGRGPLHRAAQRASRTAVARDLRGSRRSVPRPGAIRAAGGVGRHHEHVGRSGVERRRLLLEQPELEQAAAISGLPRDTDDLRHPLRTVDHLPGIGRLLPTRLPARTGGAIHAQESGCRRVRPLAEHRSLLP